MMGIIKANFRISFSCRKRAEDVCLQTTIKLVGVIMSHISTGVEYALHCMLFLADLPADAGIPPVLGCRERATLFVSALERQA